MLAQVFTLSRIDYMLDKYCNIPINWPGLQFDNLVQDRCVKLHVHVCFEFCRLEDAMKFGC